MRPRRLGGFAYSGCHRYFVTCCTWQRQCHFTAGVVEALAPIMLTALRERGHECLAWVFMPDHAHLLLEGLTSEARFRDAMTLARQRTAVAFRRERGTPLWQDGYFERVLRREEDSGAVIAYILNNPVRAGLVQEWNEYALSWSVSVADLVRSGRG
ncbi:MAG: transposase [Acidobacteria bacterium]|nr:MAG: transposase [Acidobacteriota bacterium]